MTRTLYYSPGSCALAPHIVLEEAGTPYGLQLVETGKGGARTPEFRRVNPKGRVPVFVDGEFVLTEAAAILLHLAISHPDARLIPGSDTGLVRAVEWLNWLGTVHAAAVRMIWRPEDFIQDAAQRDATVAKGHEHLAAAFSLIEERMRALEWAVGPCYSIVDPYLLVFFRWGNRMSIDMRTLYPAWTRHALRVIERPAVKRALQQENVSVWQ